MPRKTRTAKQVKVAPKPKIEKKAKKAVVKITKSKNARYIRRIAQHLDVHINGDSIAHLNFYADHFVRSVAQLLNEQKTATKTVTEKQVSNAWLAYAHQHGIDKDVIATVSQYGTDAVAAYEENTKKE